MQAQVLGAVPDMLKEYLLVFRIQVTRLLVIFCLISLSRGIMAAALRSELGCYLQRRRNGPLLSCQYYGPRHYLLSFHSLMPEDVSIQKPLKLAHDFFC